ncbi:MAG: hypothetical protein H6729_14340 [Deltaproteobacteria bacterium]|nr:hypothetical protein [Deltaproteobacteria bacterium]
MSALEFGKNEQWSDQHISFEFVGIFSFKTFVGSNHVRSGWSSILTATHGRHDEFGRGKCAQEVAILRARSELLEADGTTGALSMNDQGTGALSTVDADESAT